MHEIERQYPFNSISISFNVINSSSVSKYLTKDEAHLKVSCSQSCSPARLVSPEIDQMCYSNAHSSESILSNAIGDAYL